MIGLLLVFAAVPIFGQTTAGRSSISGVVRDPSGAVVPGAAVAITNESQGLTRTLSTTDAGLFNAPALMPGPGYSIKVTASGFSTYEAKNLTLMVGQNLNLTVDLVVGSTTTQVEVTAAAQLLQDTKTDVSGVVDSRAIQNLPTNGRRVDAFVLTQPGVSADGNYGLLSFRGVAGQNSFLVDGTDTTDQFWNENGGRTRIISQISLDAVQEFQVVSSNYSAEYGRAMGGIMNTVTRSGSNDLHGTAYGFFRSTGMEAHDPFAKTRISEKRRQGGASLGGPVIKDKLFFFLNADITRRNFPMSSSINTTAVDGSTETWKLCGVASGGLPAATPAQCSAINALLPRFYGQIPRTLNQELYFGRMDYHPTDRQTITASFNFLHEVSPNGIQTGSSSTSGSAITSNGDDSEFTRNGGIAWTTIFTPTLVNEFHFGIATDRNADTFDNAELGSGLGFLQVSVNGTQLGPANYLPRIEPSERRFQYQDSLSWTKGAHAIKVGADIANTYDYTYYISNYFGSYTYQTVNAFALDYGSTAGTKNWQSYSQTFGSPVEASTINDYGFYAQDQWRATRKLTVNYGIRYEYSQWPQPPASGCNSDFPLTCHINSPTNNWEPRVGAAYRLNDKTVLRAGFGVYHARFQGGRLTTSSQPATVSPRRASRCWPRKPRNWRPVQSSPTRSRPSRLSVRLPPSTSRCSRQTSRLLIPSRAASPSSERFGRIWH